MSKLTIWTVYKSPKDYPDHWVLRAHDVPGGPRSDCFVSKSLAKVRAQIPMGCTRLTPVEDDDPVIFEVWM